MSQFRRRYNTRSAGKVKEFPVFDEDEVVENNFDDWFEPIEEEIREYESTWKGKEPVDEEVRAAKNSKMTPFQESLVEKLLGIGPEFTAKREEPSPWLNLKRPETIAPATPVTLTYPIKDVTPLLDDVSSDSSDDDDVPSLEEDIIVLNPVPAREEWEVQNKLQSMQIKNCTSVTELQNAKPSFESTALRKKREMVEEIARKKREEEERLARELAQAEKELEELRLQEEARQAEVNRRWLENAKRQKEDEVCSEITKMLNSPEARLGMAVVYLLERNKYADLDDLVRSIIRNNGNVYITDVVTQDAMAQARQVKYSNLLDAVSEDVLKGNTVVPKNTAEGDVPKLYDMSLLDSYDIVADN